MKLVKLVRVELVAMSVLATALFQEFGFGYCLDIKTHDR